METGKQYLYFNIKRVYDGSRYKCRKEVTRRMVTFKGWEGSKAVFETDAGSEILIHQDDIETMIKEV